MSKFIRSPTCN